MEIVRLTSEGTKRARECHPWIFSNELEPGFASLPAGEQVEIRGSDNRCYGVGLLSPNSLIAVRRYALKKDPIDKSLLDRRIRKAVSLRQLWFPEDKVYRLVHGEGDDLPGMTIDRYEDVVVVQVLTSGVQRLLGTISDILNDIMDPKGILARYDTAYRDQESLPNDPVAVSGEVPRIVTVTMDDLSFAVDVWKGHKTGLYLDQRPARRMIQGQVKGRSVLDLFCYSGAFSMYAAKGGAAKIIGVDSSQDALNLAGQNAHLNGYQDRCQWRQADVFDFLKGAPDELFDVVLMDPPSLVKNRRKKLSGLRAYRDLNARAMQWVKSGGKLLTSSCSGLVDHQEFFQALGEAAVKAAKTVRLIERLPQGIDHPVRPEIPQTEYLKSYWLEVD
jgi:23S rRNA (cytosine1962-C5)-methyltransferase